MKRLATIAVIALASLVASRADAQTINMPNTVWTGSETLPGYGKLAFQFKANNQVTMIDAKETSHGQWTIKDNKIVLSFYNGGTAYIGGLNGYTLSGKASNGKTMWDWTVTLANPPQQAPQEAPPQHPQPAPMPNNPQPAPKAKALTPQTLPDFLRNQGYTPQVITPEIGSPYCLIKASDKDWDFAVEVSVDRKGGLWLTMRLDQVADIKAAKLAQLLEANNAVAPCFFLYRAEDQRLCLKMESFTNSLRADLQTLMRVTRESHSLWKSE